MKKYIHITIFLLVCSSFTFFQDKSLLESAYLARQDKRLADSLFNSFVHQWQSETQRLPIIAISSEKEKLSRLVQKVYDEIITVPGSRPKYLLVQDSIPVITFNNYLYGIPSNRIQASDASVTLYLTRKIDSLLHHFVDDHTILEAGVIKDEGNSSMKFLMERGIHLTYDMDFHYRDFEWDHQVLKKQQSYRKGILITPTVPYLSHLVTYGSTLKNVTAVVVTHSGKKSYDYILKGREWKLKPPRSR